MDKVTTSQKIITLVAEHLMLEEADIVESSTFVDLGIDSLDEIEIIMEVENSFNVEIPDSAAGAIKTVGDLVGLVESLISKQ
jgi:acyl carrier protein